MIMTSKIKLILSMLIGVLIGTLAGKFNGDLVFYADDGNKISKFQIEAGSQHALHELNYSAFGYQMYNWENALIFGLSSILILLGMFFYKDIFKRYT